jgi:hypothetical protein
MRLISYKCAIPRARAASMTTRGDFIDDEAASSRAPRQHDPDASSDGDLSDMLGELRVLLPSAQLLSAFLITVPFNSGFANIVASEKRVFLATFVLSISSLVLLSAPAVQHRVMRPLMNRARFKHLATRQVLVGSVTLSMALVLGTQLVLSEVFGDTIGSLAASAIGVLILALWWVLPKVLKARGQH